MYRYGQCEEVCKDMDNVLMYLYTRCFELLQCKEYICSNIFLKSTLPTQIEYTNMALHLDV